MKFELQMPEVQMTDDMKLSTTWGIIRGYRERIEALEAALREIEQRSDPDGPGHLMPPRKILEWVRGKARAALKQD